MFIAALFSIAKRWKKTKCPSTDEWVNNLCHNHTMKCSLVIRRNELVTLVINATTWMDLSIIRVRERSQTESSIFCMSTFI